MSKALIKPSLVERYKSGKYLTTLAAEAIALAQLIIANNGEITPEVEEALEVNERSIARKIDGYKTVEDYFEAVGEVWRNKATNCNAIARTFSNRVEKLRSNIKSVMKQMGKAELSGSEYRYLLGRSAAKLVIEDESLIPAEFKMPVQTIVIDTERLKQALINGFEVPGAHIEENGTLRVYENSGRD